MEGKEKGPDHIPGLTVPANPGRGLGVGVPASQAPLRPLSCAPPCPMARLSPPGLLSLFLPPHSLSSSDLVIFVQALENRASSPRAPPYTPGLFHWFWPPCENKVEPLPWEDSQLEDILPGHL